MKIINQWLQRRGEEIKETNNIGNIIDEMMLTISRVMRAHPKWYGQINNTKTIEEYERHPYFRQYLAIRNKAVLEIVDRVIEIIIADEDHDEELIAMIAEHLSKHWATNPKKGQLSNGEKRK